MEEQREHGWFTDDLYAQPQFPTLRVIATPRALRVTVEKDKTPGAYREHGGGVK